MTRSLKAVLAGLTVAITALSSAQIQVQVDGNAVYFPNAKPQYVNGRVLVPLRGVFEQLGANVSWSRATQTVLATRGTTNVELHIGSREATVNGSTVDLDVPPMIMNGSTMVPIRFVSEALGAQVGWIDAQQLVTISTVTGDSTSIKTPVRTLRRVVIRADEVIPVSLNRQLSSLDNKTGDRFTATVRTGSSSDYAGIPEGTKVEGHIAAVHARDGNKPGILDLSFDRLRFPDGHVAKFSGTLTSLDDKHVDQDANGVLTARTGNGQDQRMIYAGYGAGAGLLLGVLTKRPLEDTVLGGVLGYIVGQVQHDQRKPTNVTLAKGTEMGVRVDRDITMSW